MKAPAKGEHGPPTQWMDTTLAPPLTITDHTGYLLKGLIQKISETVVFKQKYLTIPTVTHADRVAQAAKTVQCTEQEEARDGEGNPEGITGTQQNVPQTH